MNVVLVGQCHPVTGMTITHQPGKLGGRIENDRMCDVGYRRCIAGQVLELSLRPFGRSKPAFPSFRGAYDTYSNGPVNALVLWRKPRIRAQIRGIQPF